MKTINPDPGRLQQLLANASPDQPIVMINLLRFNEQARYPDQSPHCPCSGREAYRRYSATALRHVRAAGGDLVWQGRCQDLLIGPADEHWHQALLVRYPSLQDFAAMVSQPDYQSAAEHRTAALADSRLIMTEES